MRGFGSVCRRQRGGIEPWVGEDVFCRASRAIRFPQRFHTGSPMGMLGPIATGCAFRRMHCTGGPMTRVEIGLAMRLAAGPALIGARVGAIVTWAADLPTEVPGSARNPAHVGPLCEVGPAVAERLLWATTGRDAAAAPSGRWIHAGTPMMLLEYRRGDLVGLPAHVRTLVAGDANLELAHVYLRCRRQTVGVYFLQVGPRPARDLHRRLRLHLVRMHAERETLRLVLRSLATGVLETRPGSPGTETLQRYLLDSLRLLTRQSVYGIDREELLPMVHASADLVDPGLRSSLLAALEQARQSVRSRVRDATRQRRTRDPIFVVHNGELTMNQFKIELGDNTVIHGDFVVAQKIQESFNQVANSAANPELKEQLQALSAAVADLTTHLPQEEARQAARDLDTITNEALSETPRKAWYELAGEGLIAAALRVGEAAGAVARLVRRVVMLLGG